MTVRVGIVDSGVNPNHPHAGQVMGGVFLHAEGESPENDVYTIALRTELTGLTAFRLEALPDSSLPQGGSGRALS